MTRSEWVRSVVNAHWDEPCPVCGHPANNWTLDDDGALYQYCEVCRREHFVEDGPMPSSFEPEPDADGDLPF